MDDAQSRLIGAPTTCDRVEFPTEFLTISPPSTSLLLPKHGARAAGLNPSQLSEVEHVK